MPSPVVAPPRLFTCFVTSESGGAPAAWLESRVTRYVVDRIEPVRGKASDIGRIEAGGALVRVESPEGLAMPDAPLIGVTTHLVYTSAADRRDLALASAPESGPTAVLIPISEIRRVVGHGPGRATGAFSENSGHLSVGMPFADRIFRRLYHARHLPGARWDFLTYFEFPPDRAGEFEALLAGLRDTARNPEWTFVEREVEIWLTRVAERA